MLLLWLTLSQQERLYKDACTFAWISIDEYEVVDFPSYLNNREIVRAIMWHMEPSLRVVTKLPLEELWNNDGVINASRQSSLSVAEITSLLRKGNVQFVVADVGHQLQWIPSVEAFTFWKSEAKHHIAEPNSGTDLDAFPASYSYIASAWNAENQLAIILLEKTH